jgi:hypothetical protein
MKIVPPPRSSWVRVKLVGAPPDSYFDFPGFNFQTPMNGSFVLGAVTPRADVRGTTGVGLAGCDRVCGLATTPDESSKIAAVSIKACRELRMSRLRS